MTTQALCFFAQLKNWDADFYNHLAALDHEVDRLEGNNTGNGCLTPQNWQTLFDHGRVTQNDCRSIFAKFSLYETQLRLGQQREKLVTWFGIKPTLSVAVIINKLNQLLAEKKISKEEVPWIAHATIRNFLQYKQADSSRPLEVVFSQGVYDCSEQTEIMQQVCNAFGIENKAVVFWIAPDLGHTFLAYKISGKWGYASVARFADPQYPSLFEVCQTWEWRRQSGVYHFGAYNKGQFVPQGYYEV